MKRRALILTCMAALAAVPAHGGLRHWSPIGPEGLAQIDSLAFNPRRPDVVYAGMNGGGVARSEDGGLTWTTRSEGWPGPRVVGLTVHPRLSRLVYGLSDSDLVRSTNGGRTWSSLQPRGQGVNAFAPVPSDPALLYAGTDAGLFRSADSGDTWDPVAGIGLSAGYGVDALAVDPTDPGLLYAGITGFRGYGFWVSRDAGRTWTRRLHGIPQRLFTHPRRTGTVYLLRNGVLQRSRDSGLTWDLFFAGATDLIFDPRDSATAYVLSFDGALPGRSVIHKTTDDGAHWTALASGLAEDATITALAVSPAGPLLAGSRMIADFVGSLLRSTDGGATWDPVGRGLINTTIGDIAFGSPGTIFASGRGLFRSRDDGATWSKVLDLTGIRALAVDPFHRETAYAGTVYSFGADPRIVWKTTDGGDTWTALPYPQLAASPLSGLHVMDLVTDPLNPDVVWLATRTALVGPGPQSAEGLYRSPDGGQTWAKIDFPNPSGSFISLAVHPGQREIWALSPFGLYKSADDGLTRSLALTGSLDNVLVAVAVAPSDPSVVWVEASASNDRTTDGGASWWRLPGAPGYTFDTPTHPLAIDPADPFTVYEARVNGVFRKSPGLRWQEFEDGLFNRQAGSIAFDPADPGRLLVGTSGAGIYEYRFAP